MYKAGVAKTRLAHVTSGNRWNTWLNLNGVLKYF